MFFLETNDIINYAHRVIAPIAQLVSALDFNFERAVKGSILTADKRLNLKKSECNNSGYKLTGLTMVAVTDWGGANSRFLGLVSVGAARSNGIETVCHQKNPSN